MGQRAGRRGALPHLYKSRVRERIYASPSWGRRGFSAAHSHVDAAAKGPSLRRGDGWFAGSSIGS